MDKALTQKFTFILHRNLAKATAQEIGFARPVIQ